MSKSVNTFRYLALALAVFAISCKTGAKPDNQSTSGNTGNQTTSETNSPKPTNEYKRPRYNPSAPRINDIQHMRLEVSFDFAKKHLKGKATLDIKPHFYPVKELVLDAKGFEIHSIQLVTAGLKDLKYTYDDKQIRITLDREYKNTETYKVQINYTAKPDELAMGGSAAIAGDKGLYFINPDGKDSLKHVEIWTQGETEANSCWFPTNDKPNEKITHELLITVPDQFETLSNGLLTSSKKNSDGTRTDTWNMSLPHAPYLVMMAIGDYAIVKDSWTKKNGQKIEVAYYVEKEYEQYARDIFGKTPKMLQFFSDRLGVEYPWEKYAQVVVRDYVSGAMENTTATIHGEFLYRTRRELLDDHNESIIAHELFHHWFGDLVTCESWANLPLNESFANYSQFLWDEFEHGADEADHHAYMEMSGYLATTMQSGYVDMVRYDYLDKEEMFDAHSYNKGGRILHMLRQIVGDDAFFTSIKTYLSENQYQPAEMHQLRLAFEKVTGQDMNWFFNQWFFAKGHPNLSIRQELKESEKEVWVIVQQRQDINQVPVYILPLNIDVYTSSGKTTHAVKVENILDTFRLKYNDTLKLVNFDASKTLLCEKNDLKSIDQFVYQYYHAPKYLDRREAIEECSKSSNPNAQKVIADAMNDASPFLRELAMRKCAKAIKTQKDLIRQHLVSAAKSDKSTSVRSAAIMQLAKNFANEPEHNTIYEAAVKDSSYAVIAAGLNAYSKTDKTRALALADEFAKEKNMEIRFAVAEIYAEFGDASKHDFFTSSLKSMGAGSKYQFVMIYSNYLKHQSDAEIDKGMVVFEDIAANGKPWYLKFAGYQALSSFQGFYSTRSEELNIKAESLRAEGNKAEADRMEMEAKKAAEKSEMIAKRIREIKAKETDKEILKYVR
jgi:aminopeptidase N